MKSLRLMMALMVVAPVGCSMEHRVWKAPPQGMVLIPGGKFEMGDHYNVGRPDEKPVHAVHVDSFYMAQHEVTTQQYCDYLNSALSQDLIEVRDGAVYASGGSKPYCDTRKSDPDSRISFDGSTFTVAAGKQDHPMVEVAWYGAAAYCNWKSAQEGKESCYDLVTWECDFSKNSYRLPTEAEWEYAARGGLKYFMYPWGDDIDGSKANYWGSGDPYETDPWPRTTPVGYYNGTQTPAGSDMANGYGLYDMIGNVWEWCNDWYGNTYYSVSPKDNPTGPTSFERTRRVLRGGSWISGENYCRVTIRSNHFPELSSTPPGFRVVLGLDRSTHAVKSKN